MENDGRREREAEGVVERELGSTYEFLVVLFCFCSEETAEEGVGGALVHQEPMVIIAMRQLSFSQHLPTSPKRI